MTGSDDRQDLQPDPAARHVRAGVRIERREEERENIFGLVARAFFWVSVGVLR
jgi:hypothetical protein